MFFIFYLAKKDMGENVIKKDGYESFALRDLSQDWKYCIEGYDIDGNQLRVIVTFTEDLMPIITDH